jgi:nitrite reductase/ring-hydroxylating ferredoxin subunit
MTSVQSSATDLRAELPRLGLRSFWYPALLAAKVGEKPVSVKLLGEEIAFFRDAGKVVAFHDRCPHRGMPLSCGQRRYPGTLSCAYHGWTFDTAGKLIAALNEGPASPLPGKVQLRTYPVEERNGIVWVWMGAGAPKRLEDDVPPELLGDGTIIKVHTEVWDCSWLPAVENLMDSHDIFVHRNSPFYLFRKLPSWLSVGADVTADGKAINLTYTKMGPLQDDYPAVGRWPKQIWWRRWNMNSPKPGEYPTTELRLPGIVRVGFSGMMYVRWMVPVDDGHVRAFLFSSQRASGLAALRYHIGYALWTGWSFMNLFIGQDRVIFEKQDYDAPERLAQTDVGVIKWRRMLAAQATAECSGLAAPAHIPDVVPAVPPTHAG